jgi:hypothetical protein
MIDKTPPKLLNFRLPNEIDLSQVSADKITFQVEAMDEEGGSGLSEVIIEIDRFLSTGLAKKHVVLFPGYSTVDGQVTSTDTFVDATPTTAEMFHTVGRGTPAGVVNVTRIIVIDKADRFKIYTAAELEALGFNTQIKLVNAQAPAAPTAAIVAAAGSDSAARQFEGTSEAGTTIYLTAYSDAEYRWISLGTATTGQDGKWSITATGLDDGVYNKVSAWAVDAKGNASGLSSSFVFDVWSEGLAAPSMVVPMDAAGRVGAATPMVTGTGVPYAQIQLFADGKLAGKATADGAGNWSILSDILSKGAHALTVQQITGAGTTSPMSAPTPVVIDVTSKGIKFAISSLTAPAGVNADAIYVQQRLDDTAARLSEFIDADVTVRIAVTVADLGYPVASAGALWGGITAARVPIFRDAILNLNVAHESLYQEGNLTNPHIYAHEILHVLGFSSYTPTFANYVRKVGDVSYFHGPNAMAIHGGPVPLDASLAHLVGYSDLMGASGALSDAPNYGATNPYMPFSTLDIAILKDIGWATKPVLVSNDGHMFVAGSGKAGYDQVDGTPELDIFFINQNRSTLTGKWVDGEYVLSNPFNLTSHSLNGIERVLFADTVLALDVDGVGGQVYRLYQAVFGRTPDAAGLGYWIGHVDNGMTIAQAADLFVASAEFKTLYGAAPTSEEIVTKLYANVLHRAPDQAGFDYWLPIIENNPDLVEEVLVAFSESAENKEQVAKIIGNGFEYEPYG